MRRRADEPGIDVSLSEPLEDLLRRAPFSSGSTVSTLPGLSAS